ncbi:MAG: molybdopterin-dependent oxidoreductase [Candidatus Bathyarchaeia archaeon]|jgi:DMSO/TMAO reductase YedYZ molybdopterin-dependent catalytic subunit
MNKASKIAIAALIVVIAVTVPVYFYMRQNAGVEGSILVRGAVDNPQNFTYSELKAFTTVTIQVTLSSSSHVADNGVFNYTGVPLSAVLQEAHISPNATSVYLQAADGYGATIPLQDANNPHTILAYEKDGSALTPLSEGGEGPIRLIIGNDEFAQRWVRGIAVIEAR